jgi:hypothetical protein
LEIVMTLITYCGRGHTWPVHRLLARNKRVVFENGDVRCVQTACAENRLNPS